MFWQHKQYQTIKVHHFLYRGFGHTDFISDDEATMMRINHHSRTGVISSYCCFANKGLIRAWQVARPHVDASNMCLKAFKSWFKIFRNESDSVVPLQELLGLHLPRNRSWQHQARKNHVNPYPWNQIWSDVTWSLCKIMRTLLEFSSFLYMLRDCLWSLGFRGEIMLPIVYPWERCLGIFQSQQYNFGSFNSPLEVVHFSTCSLSSCLPAGQSRQNKTLASMVKWCFPHRCVSRFNFNFLLSSPNLLRTIVESETLSMCFHTVTNTRIKDHNKD